MSFSHLSQETGGVASQDTYISFMKKQTTKIDFSCTHKDYQMMASALAYLGDHWIEQPDYKCAAKRAGISAHHFHKTFTRWAGVSPKRYVGALAHNAASDVLGSGGTVEDASFEAGLSSPSRLYDLFIKHEALSPGEAKSKAAGVDMVWGAANCPFGVAVGLISPRGLSAYGFCERGGEQDAFEDFARRYPRANYTRGDKAICQVTEQIFGGGVLPRRALRNTISASSLEGVAKCGKRRNCALYGYCSTNINNPKAVASSGRSHWR